MQAFQLSWNAGLFRSVYQWRISMSFIQEFKAFAMRGNVVDLAVGVVIGGAFGKIVTSLVNDIIMPPLNLITAKSGANFKEMAFKYPVKLPKLADGKPVLDDAGQPVVEMVNYSILNYGAFIQSVVDFTLVALAIFCVIKLMNSMKKEEAAPAAPAAPPEDVVLLREIRDALRK
jgi:large conductance mechanosensitive channel